MSVIFFLREATSRSLQDGLHKSDLAFLLQTRIEQYKESLETHEKDKSRFYVKGNYWEQSGFHHLG